MVKKSQKMLSDVCDVLHMLLNYGIMIYMLLIIVVLPFYFKQGYGRIATDKLTFFCKISLNIGKVLIPTLILYAITSIAANYSKIGSFIKTLFSKTGIKKIICKISAIDFFVGMYGVSVVLSYLCSDYKEIALWGTSGWYMGFIPQMILVCGYFLIVRFWEPKKWVFCLIFPVAAVVFVLGYLNRFGYYPIEMAYANGSFISTIGNINWYCSYVVPVLFVGIGLFWWQDIEEDAKKPKIKTLRILGKTALGIYIFLGFATLVTQGSASGIFALGVMMAVLFCLSARDMYHMRQFWMVALLLSAGCLLSMVVRNWFPEAITIQEGIIDLLTQGEIPIIMTLVSCVGLLWTLWSCKKKKRNDKFLKRTAILCATLVSCIAVVYAILLTINTLNPGALGKFSEYGIFTFSDDWGSKRGATWKVGALCFWEQDFLHKLVGVGPDAMWPYINANSSETLTELVQKNFGTKLMLTNAHNEWLTVLVNYGILGLASFAGMIVSAVRTYFKYSKASAVTAKIATACALGILSHTINNMFSFQQVMNVTMLFLLLGMGRAFQKSALTTEHIKGVLQEQQAEKSA